MILVQADWVCPIDRPPLARGWVAVESGRIAALGGPNDTPPDDIETCRDAGRAAILPGLVNAHTHLELSWLRDQVPRSASFIGWISQLLAARGRRMEQPGDPRMLSAAAAAAREAREAGTIAVGDVSNSLGSIDAIAGAGLLGVVFHELLGFNDVEGSGVARTRDARSGARVRPGVRLSVAPHAPYSVSPELFRAIRTEIDRSEVPITSIHVGESQEELALLADGSGPWPGMLRFIGSWRDDWVPPRCGPVEYLDDLGLLDRRTLVVHGVQLGDASLARLAARGCTLVTCPRSNQWVGVGVPPIARFYAADVLVAVGTDSLASVEDLNLFAELAEMRWLAPDVPARRLIESATRIGAMALGLDTDLGTLAPGKRADLISVDLPTRVDDVEEYLVSGIQPRQVRWIET
jgi:cytosine/adenosine deaminase-related metal-dependent hydrolase